MPKRRTQSQFIEEARAKHGDFYDYKKVCYVDSGVKVIVICPKHGDFEIRPNDHLKGVGCRKCFGDRMRNTQDTILARFREAHGDRYNYDKVVYKDMNLKVTITCSVHGDFKQDPQSHIRGSGCQKCATEKIVLARMRNAQDTILARFREAHGDRYKYDKVVYKGINLKVTITCAVHGDFKQDPHSHISGSGCQKCAVEKIALARITRSASPKEVTARQALISEELIKRFRAKHGDKYDYSQVEYVNGSIKATIICSQHGAFEQTPKNHITGRGCPKCARESTSEKRFAFLYKDVRYRSIKHACEELNKDYCVVSSRLRVGWTAEQAFEDEARPPRRSFKVNGVIYHGVEDAVRRLNAPVSVTTVKKRLRAGMTPEEALFTPRKLGHDNGAVYLITNLVNSKQFVGLTTTSLEERWKRHLDKVFSQKGSLIHKAIAEFGKENFTIEVLEHASNIKELQAKERNWIQKLNTQTPNGYNVTLGGELGGSLGKPTRLPGDPTLYPTIKAAAEALAKRKGISQCAAERRIYAGRLDVSPLRKPTKLPGDPALYPTVKAAAEALARREGISQSAAKHRICAGRLDVKKSHGMSKTKFYGYWRTLVHKCANPKSRDYNGSTVCDRWQEFENFKADMYDSYQEGMGLALLDPTQPYSTDNCKWMVKAELSRHRRSSARGVKPVESPKPGAANREKASLLLQDNATAPHFTPIQLSLNLDIT